MSKRTSIPIIPKRESLDNVLIRLGQPSGGITIEQLKERLVDLMDYYKYYNETAKKELVWNKARVHVEQILKKSAELKAVIEKTPYAALPYINTAAQMLASEADGNPFAESILIFPGSPSLALLGKLEAVCKKSLDIFGGEHKKRPHTIGLKVRITCYIAHIFHEHYGASNPVGTNRHPVSMSKDSSFYQLIESMFNDGENIFHAVRKTKEKYKAYLAGDTDWWVKNVENIASSSLGCKVAIAEGLYPQTEGVPTLVYTSEEKKLILQRW